MTLTVHLDNQLLSLVLFDGNDPVVSSSLAADQAFTPDQCAASIQGVLCLRGADLSQVTEGIFGSVVPPLTHSLRQALELLLPGRPLLAVGPGIKTGLNMRLENVPAVGADFVCTAAAALAEFSPPLVVLSLADAATTFLAIDREGCLVGRSIVPGVESSLANLHHTAAQLPAVAFEPRCRLLGRGTADAIRSGILYGSAAMIDGMLDRYQEALGGGATVVATGRLAPAVLAQCRHPAQVRPLLVHEGLRLLCQRNR